MPQADPIRILSIGEAMVEMSRAPDPDLWRMGFAGDTLNTAWYLRRLLDDAWQVDYLTRVGTGDFSTRMVEFLRAEGLGTAHVTRQPDAEIGLYAISLTNGERSFSYWRDTSAARRLADDPTLLHAALQGCAMAYLSGITLAILPPQGRIGLLQALDRARQAGTTVVFDTNLRPRLWTAWTPCVRSRRTLPAARTWSCPASTTRPRCSAMPIRRRRWTAIWPWARARWWSRMAVGRSGSVGAMVRVTSTISASRPRSTAPPRATASMRAIWRHGSRGPIAPVPSGPGTRLGDR